MTGHAHEFEEEDLGNVYNLRLLRRLLGYAVPHARYLALAIVLLLSVA